MKKRISTMELLFHPGLDHRREGMQRCVKIFKNFRLGRVKCFVAAEGKKPAKKKRVNTGKSTYSSNNQRDNFGMSSRHSWQAIEGNFSVGRSPQNPTPWASVSPWPEGTALALACLREGYCVRALISGKSLRGGIRRNCAPIPVLPLVTLGKRDHLCTSVFC